MGWLFHGRTPQGVRGLKFGIGEQADDIIKSPPARGAWIEMTAWLDFGGYAAVAPRKGRVD